MITPYESYYSLTFDLESKDVINSVPNRMMGIPWDDCVVINLVVGPIGTWEIAIRKDGIISNYHLTKFKLKRKLIKMGFAKDIMNFIYSTRVERNLNTNWG
jgi:hypothetical protein